MPLSANALLIVIRIPSRTQSTRRGKCIPILRHLYLLFQAALAKRLNGCRCSIEVNASIPCRTQLLLDGKSSHAMPDPALQARPSRLDSSWSGWKVWAIYQTDSGIPLSIKIDIMEKPDNLHVLAVLEQAKENAASKSKVRSLVADTGSRSSKKFLTPSRKANMHKYYMLLCL
jgi:hypothetical protein